MPVHLRPKAPIATDAILVGDPGRALLLAQELLEPPKMSNHARGLWGYSGRTPAGNELTIQSTGLGAPSAAAVLSDLFELGVRRAIRVGTCAALADGVELGELLNVSEAMATEGSAAAFGLSAGAAVEPDRLLFERLRDELGAAGRASSVASLDVMPSASRAAATVPAADMQTVALLAHGRALEVALAAVLVVTEAPAGAPLDGEPLEAAVKEAGRAAGRVLSA